MASSFIQASKEEFNSVLRHCLYSSNKINHVRGILRAGSYKMPKLKRRSTSQRNAEMARQMRERRIDDDFRLLENRRRATSHKIERHSDELRTEENKKREPTKC